MNLCRQRGPFLRSDTLRFIVGVTSSSFFELNSSVHPLSLAVGPLPSSTATAGGVPDRVPCEG